MRQATCAATAVRVTGLFLLIDFIPVHCSRLFKCDLIKNAAQCAAAPARLSNLFLFFISFQDLTLKYQLPIPPKTQWDKLIDSNCTDVWKTGKLPEKFEVRFLFASSNLNSAPISFSFNFLHLRFYWLFDRCSLVAVSQESFLSVWFLNDFNVINFQS